MTYYTKYSLSYTPKPGTPDTVYQCDHPKPDKANYCPECGSETKGIPILWLLHKFIEHHHELYYAVLTEECVQWTNWTEAMLDLSRKFTTIIFELTGMGESAGDIWKAYFLNGKYVVHEPKIIFPLFNEDDLHE